MKKTASFSGESYSLERCPRESSGFISCSIKRLCEKMAFALALTVVAGLMAPMARGQTINWIGSSSTSWFNDANWSGGSKPASGNTVWVYYSTAPLPTRYCIVDGGVGTTGVADNVFLSGVGTTLNRLDVSNALTVATKVFLGGNSKLNILSTGTLSVTNLAVGGDSNSSSANAAQWGTVTVATELQIGSGNGSAATTYTAVTGVLTVNGANSWIGRVGTTRDGVGVLNINGAAVTLLDVHSGRGGSATYASKGTVAITAGSLNCRNFYNGNSAGTLTAASNEALFAVSGGTVDVSQGYYNGFSRTVGDSKVFPTTRVIGSNATFRVRGDYASITNARLEVVLTGPEHTAIRVDGNVALNGTFSVETNGIYKVKGGDSWDIIVADADGVGANTLSGTFKIVNFSKVQQLGNWKLKYDVDNKKVVLSMPAKGTLVRIN